MVFLEKNDKTFHGNNNFHFALLYQRSKSCGDQANGVLIKEVSLKEVIISEFF